MPHPLSLILAPAAILLGIVALLFLTGAFLRGNRIPQCWQCGAHKVRSSKATSLWDFAGMVLFLRPYRCSGCRTRFHALKLSRTPADPA
jgi:hypothetical protein